jgi:hypothetical protein
MAPPVFAEYLGKYAQAQPKSILVSETSSSQSVNEVEPFTENLERLLPGIAARTP